MDRVAMHGTGAGYGGTQLPVKRINAFIIELYQAAREIHSSRFREWVFDHLQDLIAFDSGIWVQGTMEYGPQVHEQYLYRQPEEMMHSYEVIKGQDVLFQRAFEQLGRTLDLYSVVSRDGWIKRVEYTEHCKRYGIEAVISTVFLDSDTRLLTALSFYRANPDHLFSETDRATKEMLTPHLIEAYRISLFIHLHMAACTCKSDHHASALCDRLGVIHQSESNFAGLLRHEWQDWMGPLLPDPIIRLVQDGGNTAEGKKIDICIEPLDNLYQIQLCLHSPLCALSPRERVVADLLSEGLPYKEIAANLGLSPSTVTNHANAIYKKLQVDGRSELSRLARAGH